MNEPVETEDLPKFETPIDQRAYRHRFCGEETIVSGHDFEMLADPFSKSPTLCVHCGTPFELQHFEWADTGERLTAYHKRIHPKGELLEQHNRYERLGKMIIVPVAAVVGFATLFTLQSFGVSDGTDVVVGLVAGGASIFVVSAPLLKIVGNALDIHPVDYRQFK